MKVRLQPPECHVKLKNQNQPAIFVHKSTDQQVSQPTEQSTC